MMDVIFNVVAIISLLLTLLVLFGTYMNDAVISTSKTKRFGSWVLGYGKKARQQSEHSQLIKLIIIILSLIFQSWVLLLSVLLIDYILQKIQK